MANERGVGQKLIPVPVSNQFEKELNTGFKKAGYNNRSQFIRDAIIEKLQILGIVIPKELAAAPDRIGVGGRSKIPASRIKQGSFKSSTSLKRPSSAISLLDAAQAAAPDQRPKLKQKS